ncbi:integrase family protein [Polaromonas sp.]|uniref:tyrosine-type recombinase/integrase n=1 Tax=Polaromonas sp. TaxID=1869339 RepID=UPI0017C60216|nr:integrase family protein [Polaromonas sp.]NML84304.1 integrase family protein [Polaromonas sp.]
MAKIAFTAGRVAAFKCLTDKPQIFLWDVTAPGLGLRATPAGKPAYVFQGEFKQKSIRITIGSTSAWSIPQAQEKTRELQRLIDEGKDPRDLKRDAVVATTTKQAAAAAKVEADKVSALTVGEVWATYIEERRQFWGDLHFRDHMDKAKAGGLPSGRRGGGKHLTKPGPLAGLMPLRLKDLDQATIERWAAIEGKARPSSARLAWRLLTVFLTWCGEQPAYAGLLPAKNPAKTKKAREALGKAGTKSDVLQRGQLTAWFAVVQQIQNPVIAACLQMMLLTGARPGEVLALRWKDVNTQWKGISIRDKVDGTREIPATPYMLLLLSALPRRNEWVFPSHTSATGCLTEPNNPHTRACKAAGLEGLTLHGLRRSFKSLTEWLEVPVGVVAQIQGHKPSATAEKHYTVRPLELLRVHHEKIEAWILEQAGIVFDANALAGAIRVVAA